MKRSYFLLPVLLALAACATPTWTVIADPNEIASQRNAISKPNLDLSEVKILRLQLDGKRVEVTSVAPSVIGAHKGGAPAAKTTFAFTPERDKLVMFGQDVPNFKGFRAELPVAELVPGKQFVFPVVQENGAVVDKTFTVEALIVK